MNKRSDMNVPKFLALFFYLFWQRRAKSRLVKVSRFFKTVFKKVSGRELLMSSILGTFWEDSPTTTSYVRLVHQILMRTFSQMNGNKISNPDCLRRMDQLKFDFVEPKEAFPVLLPN